MQRGVRVSTLDRPRLLALGLPNTFDMFWLADKHAPSSVYLGDLTQYWSSENPYKTSAMAASQVMVRGNRSVQAPAAMTGCDGGFARMCAGGDSMMMMRRRRRQQQRGGRRKEEEEIDSRIE